MLFHLLLQDIGREIAPFIHLIGVRLRQLVASEGEDPVILLHGQFLIHPGPVDKIEEVHQSSPAELKTSTETAR